MNEELKNLVKYLKKTNNPSFSKIFKLAQEASPAKKAVEIPPDESIPINIADLQSLVDPNVKVERQEIGLFTIDK